MSDETTSADETGVGAVRENADSGNGVSLNSLGKIDWKKSFVVGASACLGSYLLTLFLHFIDGADVFTSRYFEISPFNVAGMLFFNAHNVPITVSIGNLYDGISVNFIKGVSELSRTGVAGPDTVPGVVWLLVPVVGLVAAGYVRVTDAGTGTSDAESGVLGASVTVGYLPLVTVGVLLFTTEVVSANRFMQVTAVFEPQMTNAVLVAGVVYPVVLGGVGGLVSSRLS